MALLFPHRLLQRLLLLLRVLLLLLLLLLLPPLPQLLQRLHVPPQHLLQQPPQSPQPR